MATFLTLLAAGVVENALSVQGVREARTPVLAKSTDEVVAEIVMRGPVWRDTQFPLLWVQPVEREAPPPPGLREWPEPGHVVVSPGLLARTDIIDAWGLALSPAGTGVAGTIGDDGVSTRSELLAYAAPPPGRDLGPGGARFAISGFGLPLGDDGGLLIETDAAYPSPLAAATGSLLFLAVPSSVLLAAGIRTRTQVRRRRIEILWMLGLGRQQLRVVLFVEVLGLVVPGVILGGLIGGAVLARLRALPLTGWEVAPGALAPSALASAGAVSTVLALASAMALVGTWRERWRQAAGPSVPGVVGRVAQAFGFLVIVGTLMALTLAGGSRGQWVVAVLWSTLLVLSLTWSLLTRTAIRASSRIPRHRPADASGYLARRQLAHESGSLAALVGPLGLIVLLSGAVLSVVATTSGPAEDGVISGEADGQIVSVTWRDPKPGDVARFSSELGSATPVIPVQDGVARVGACTRAASFVDLPRSVCASASRLPAVVSETWEHLTGLRIQIAPDNSWIPNPPDAQVLIRTKSTSVAYRITFDLFTAPDVYFLHSGTRIVRPVVSWLSAGVAAASAIAALAALVRFADLAMASGSGRARLERAGVPFEASRNIRARVARTALLVSTTMAASYAFLFSWAGIGAEITVASLPLIALCFLSVIIPGLALLYLVNRHGRG